MRLRLPRGRRRVRASRIVIAERFESSCTPLAGVTLPLDVIASDPPRRLRIIIAEDGHGSEYRTTTLPPASMSPGDSLRLTFAPFPLPGRAKFLLGVLELQDADTPLEIDEIQQIQKAAGTRVPIDIECTEKVDVKLIHEERRITSFLTGTAEPAPVESHPIRTAWMLDAFWCDASGMYLRGWAHAWEHPVRRLTIESTGRLATTTSFQDRPDLLQFYPEHEHVRHAGFSMYLACPPGKPVTMTLETDGGSVSFPLPLPEGPLPPWKIEEEVEGDISPALRRFATLANDRTGPLLQIGARTSAGVAPSPPRHLFRRQVFGLDIHPGTNVSLVGDAHRLSSFVREGSLGGVMSASVLEHLESPWLLAAEINRVLEPGGLVYHQVPGAWPAHAQPNDFWRISAEGLKVLFGDASGFEVLESGDSGVSAIIPAPQWRELFLDMPTVPAFSMSEILARKVRDLTPGEISWPIGGQERELRSRQYPVEGLRRASWGEYQ